MVEGWIGAGVAGLGAEAVVDGIDLGARLAAELDLTGRIGEDEPGERWAGTLPVARYAAFRTADSGDADALARSSGCRPALVRSLAGPDALGRVDVVRRDGAARLTGPTTIVTDELAWVDGGPDGLWTVRPHGPDDVAIERCSMPRPPRPGATYLSPAATGRTRSRRRSTRTT